jgi:hypothetical protein
MDQKNPKSTQEVRQEFLAALGTYIQGLRTEGKGLSARAGKVSNSAIALAAAYTLPMAKEA